MAKFLEGKKTYIVAVLMFVLAGLHAIKNMIPGLRDVPDEYWQKAMGWVQDGGLISIALLALRSGVKKAEV